MGPAAPLLRGGDRVEHPIVPSSAAMRSFSRVAAAAPRASCRV